MPIREVLRGIVFLRRVADSKDFNEIVNCIPDERMKYLEEGLIERRDAGEIDSIQIGRHRKEAIPLSPDEDQVDTFFAKIDAVRLHSSTDRTSESESEDDGSIPSESPIENDNDPIGS